MSEVTMTDMSSWQRGAQAYGALVKRHADMSIRKARGEDVSGELEVLSYIARQALIDPDALYSDGDQVALVYTDKLLVHSIATRLRHDA